MTSTDKITKFDTRADYQHALHELMARTQQRLWLFENDATEADLSSLATHTLLQCFLSASPAASMRILLLNPEHFVTHCPRLLQLHQYHSNRLEIRHLTEPQSDWKTGFLLADQPLYLKRYHFDWMRGESGANAREFADLEHVFNLFWEHSSPPEGLYLQTL